MTQLVPSLTGLAPETISSIALIVGFALLILLLQALFKYFSFERRSLRRLKRLIKRLARAVDHFDVPPRVKETYPRAKWLYAHISVQQKRKPKCPVVVEQAIRRCEQFCQSAIAEARHHRYSVLAVRIKLSEVRRRLCLSDHSSSRRRKAVGAVHRAEELLRRLLYSQADLQACLAIKYLEVGGNS